MCLPDGSLHRCGIVARQHSANFDHHTVVDPLAERAPATSKQSAERRALPVAAKGKAAAGADAEFGQLANRGRIAHGAAKPVGNIFDANKGLYLPRAVWTEDHFHCFT